MLATSARRLFSLFAAPVVLAVSCYDPPVVDTTGTSASSSSSSGMGGAGLGSNQSSSSSGDGGLGGALIGSGGAGGTFAVVSSSAASSSASSSGMGSISVVEICGAVECNTTSPAAVCCLPKNNGAAKCEMVTGVCIQSDVYSLKCDDSADCNTGSFCCLNTAIARSSCDPVCNDLILCKSNDDCPLPFTCSISIGSLKACNNP